MKKLLFVFLMFCAFMCNAQNVWQPDTVINAPGKTPEEIVACATQWAATNFAEYTPAISSDQNSVSVVLQMPFKINNLTYAAGSGVITGHIKIQARDGRFKVVMSNFNHISSNVQYNDWWSMGLILEATPEQWMKGMKWKQKREVYKRVLEQLNAFSNSVFKSAAQQIPNCIPQVEEDW